MIHFVDFDYETEKDAFFALAPETVSPIRSAMKRFLTTLLELTTTQQLNWGVQESTETTRVLACRCEALSVFLEIHEKDEPTPFSTQTRLLIAKRDGMEQRFCGQYQRVLEYLSIEAKRQIEAELLNV